MKRILIVFVMAGFAFACGTSEHKHEAAAAGQQATEEHQHESKAAVSGLTLNNGAKWNADESTNSNVEKLNGTFSKCNAIASKTMEDYMNCGMELQLGIESLIKGCRMEGPDHDALHHWLEPMMQNVKALNEATSIEQAQQSYDAAGELLSVYPQYFE